MRRYITLNTMVDEPVIDLDTAEYEGGSYLETTDWRTGITQHYWAKKPRVINKLAELQVEYWELAVAGVTRDEIERMWELGFPKRPMTSNDFRPYQDDTASYHEWGILPANYVAEVAHIDEDGATLYAIKNTETRKWVREYSRYAYKGWDGCNIPESEFESNEGDC